MAVFFNWTILNNYINLFFKYAFNKTTKTYHSNKLKVRYKHIYYNENIKYRQSSVLRA